MKESVVMGFECAPLQKHLGSVQRRFSGLSDSLGLALRIAPGLDPEAVRRALHEVVSRHESLRTRVAWSEHGTAPVQTIDADFLGWEPSEDGSSWVNGGSERELTARLDEWLRDAQELREEPAPRARLIQLPAGLVLLLSVPALSSDRRSLEILAAELDARLSQTHDGSAPPALQYADFAAWHSAMLEAPDHAGERMRWREIAARAAHFGPTAVPERHPSGLEFVPRRMPVSIDHETLQTLDAITRDGGGDVTRADAMATLWSILLWRLARPSHVSVGCLDGGRDDARVESALGLFERQLPICPELVPGMSLRDAVRELAQQRSQAQARALYLDPSDLDVAPLAGFLPYVFESRLATDLPLRRIAWGASAGCTWPYRVKLLAEGANGSPERVWLEYDASRVLPATVQTLASQLAALALAAAAQPDRSIEALHLGSPCVTPQGWPSPLRAAKPLPELFDETVARTPWLPAVEFEAETLTYEALAARARGLAACLQRRGIGNGCVVALCMERSITLPVSLLAVMKCGAAFVPIDPAYPAERILFMLSDSGAQLVLTDAHTHGRMADLHVPALEIRAGDAALEPDGPEPAGQYVAGDDLAYIMYTSGSTGRPNGVRVQHRALANYLVWCAEAYELHLGQGALVHTSVAFDLTLTALLAPWVVGQRVILLPDDRGLDALVKALRKGRDYSLLKLTPTHLTALGRLMTSSDAKGRVRQLVIGGEDLRYEMLDFWRDHAPQTSIVNEYGPTETVVGCTAFRIPADAPRKGRTPIGRSISGITTYILDSELQLVPSGVAGEICISGSGLAQGYHDRPEKTAERFVDTVHGRLYRSGDLGRWGDGQLEYLGRADEQVKIRGFRVETQEVAAALCGHPGVSEAAVSTWTDEQGYLQLVAYVVPSDSAGSELLSATELKGFLERILPAFMLPSAYVVLRELPQTPNGKLDRRALPRPEQMRPTLYHAYAAPRTSEEEMLASIYQEALRVPKIGIDDNYFALGGDSIRSIRITAEARERGLEFSVADVHNFPTVRLLGEQMEEARTRAVETPPTEPFSLISAEDRARMPEGVEDAYPMNLLQEGMIFHREFNPKSAVYHAMFTMRLRGNFVPDLFREKLVRLMDRHPLLRTSFDHVNFSQPLQLVHRSYKLPLDIQDLRGMHGDEQGQVVQAWMEHEKQRGFELNEYPLIRFKVHLLHDSVFQFTYNFHHEIIDGWSDATIVSQLFTEYFSALEGRPVEIPPPQAFFRDAVALELEALQNEAFKSFWAQNLEGAQLMRLPRLMAPPRADKGLREIVKINVAVPPELSDGVKRLASNSAVPVKSVLLASHMRVMQLMGGGKDILTYTVSNGRPETIDGDAVVGLFVNSLAFRMSMPGGTWLDLLKQTLRTERTLWPYRRYPMAEIKRQQGNDPLSETLFFYTHYHVLQRVREHSQVEVLQTDLWGESTFPYCCNMRLDPLTNELLITLEYDSLQFTRGMIDEMAHYYLAVLREMTRNPLERYDLFRPLDRACEQEMLGVWSGREVPFSADRCAHECISEVASDIPDTIALRTEEGQFTYRGLERRTNALARILRARGVGPDEAVALLLDRHSDMIVGILAILKAGGAYVPLDPSNPPARTAAILQNCGAKWIVTRSALQPLLPSSGLELVDLDALHAELRATSSGSLSNLVCPQHRAYIIYTSGSTGAPKGVAVEHLSLVNSTEARAAVYGSGPQNFLLLSPYAFDSSLAGIFGTLFHGGTLVTLPAKLPLDAQVISDAVSRDGITHCLMIPSLYSVILEHAQGRNLSSLRAVVVAGESCSRDLAESHAKALPETDFFNEYGPTEATVWSTVCRARDLADQPVLSAQLPIGTPIQNARLYVLDAQMEPVPVGVAGTLYIGGKGLARGYVGSASQTAERFVPDPHGSRPGSRLYNSGDLVRYLPSANLEFLSRVDQQIKVRGFRIEPAEIEALLDTHAAVQRSVVLAREDKAGDRMLVAYVLLKQGSELEAQEIAAFMKARLPKYMLPTRILILDRLPLTPTGKLDRNALPEPTRHLVREHVAPRTATENLLVPIWCKVLGLDDVSVFDDFFDLGGESLRALQVAGRLGKTLGFPVPVRAVFESPTIAELAARLDSGTSPLSGFEEGEIEEV